MDATEGDTAHAAPTASAIAVSSVSSDINDSTAVSFATAAAPALATPPSPDLWVGATEGTAESAASAVAVGSAPTDTADGAVDGTYIAHIDAATPPSPDLWVDATGGTTESAASAVAVGNAPAARKRKGRSKQNHDAQDARKRQRRAAFLLTMQGNTEAGT